MSVSASGDYGVVASTAGRETVNLTGGSTSHLTLQPDNPPFRSSNVSWLFSGIDIVPQSIAKGQAQRSGWTSPIQLSVYTSVSIGTDWVIPNDFQEGPYWIRAQYDDTGINEPPTSGSTIPKVIGSADAALDWVTLENGITNRFWRWTTNGDAFDTIQGTIKVEISTTQSEAGIVGTGFYSGLAEAEQ